jgi:hypothetical protein
MLYAGFILLFGTKKPVGSRNQKTFKEPNIAKARRLINAK